MKVIESIYRNQKRIAYAAIILPTLLTLVISPLLFAFSAVVAIVAVAVATNYQAQMRRQQSMTHVALYATLHQAKRELL
jgi:4-hydroxybenzoate polyprenyltransferase